MAWTTPRTWIPYELVTDTMLNTHVRDNLNAVTRVVNQVVSASGIGNVAGGTATVVYLYTLTPTGGSTLTKDGETIELRAFGALASNANTKTIAAFINGNVVAVTTVTSSGIWHLSMTIRRYSSAHAMTGSTLLLTGQPAVVAQGSFPTTWSANVVIEIRFAGTAASDLLLVSAVLAKESNG